MIDGRQFIQPGSLEVAGNRLAKHIPVAAGFIVPENTVVKRKAQGLSVCFGRIGQSGADIATFSDGAGIQCGGCSFGPEYDHPLAADQVIDNSTTGSTAASHWSASSTPTYSGSSMAGIPSFGGPPESTSLYEMVRLEKSVLNDEAAPAGGGS